MSRKNRIPFRLDLHQNSYRDVFDVPNGKTAN